MSHRFFPERPPMACRTANDRGFTLIEIISVLVLLGILAAVVVSKNIDTGADALGEMEGIRGHLRYAQMKAMNSNTTWGILLAGNTYTLQQNGAASATPFPGEDTSTHAMPTGSTASATVNPITFDQWGSPGAATITVTVTAGTASQAFTVSQITGFIP